jgi:CheY-like chemotaxis protein
MPTILVVDDDKDITFMLRMMLEKEGYKVVEAGSGLECLEKFDHIQPDLIFIDIIMQGIDGWEVCRRIKERKQSMPVPISMLSVRKDEEDIKKSLEYARADAHINKPIDMLELLSVVRELLK